MTEISCRYTFNDAMSSLSFCWANHAFEEPGFEGEVACTENRPDALCVVLNWVEAVQR